MFTSHSRAQTSQHFEENHKKTGKKNSDGWDPRTVTHGAGRRYNQYAEAGHSGVLNVH